MGSNLDKTQGGAYSAMDELRPRLIAFELTRRCRFSCRHCRANAGPAGDKDGLSTGQCKKIIASIAEFTATAKRKPGCTIIVTGGEPMERDDVYELVKYIRDKGLRAVLATCGYLLDDESIARLKQAGIQALSFSLDGSSPESHDAFRQSKGAFDTVVKAAGLARRAGMPFQINTTLSKINADEIRGIADQAKKLGAICFNPFILVPTGRAKQIEDEILDPVEYEALLNELLRIKLAGEIDLRVTCGPQFNRVCEQARGKGLVAKGTGCMGGMGFGFISYRGDVQACGFLDISAGNLVENGYDFGRIWLKSKLLNEIRDRSAYHGRCASCDFVGTCGGCRARAMAVYGDYLADDPVCGYQPGDNA